jgi:hypothetical protein
MAQSFMDRRYPIKVWAGTVSAAILAVALAASLWVFFGQSTPLALRTSPSAHADGTD